MKSISSTIGTARAYARHNNTSQNVRTKAMSEELGKQYEPQALESKWYDLWETSGYFQADPKREGPAYSIVIPPPNVTGRLHMGHCLNSTLQDILIRWKRMSGFNVLWLPGTDHAGIATQNVVEKGMRARGEDRRAMGREAFVERVWEWREEYGGIILDQLRRMGCSCDWSRTRFTLDDGLSRAVAKVFKHLYDEGLVYRGTYLVNWCPQDQTVLSDDEVEYREVKGHLWHIRYPLAESARADGAHQIDVPTTRPETMLGDTAVAFNPKDERYTHLLGKHCILPLTGRKIPFIADEHVDPAFGTGLVKVTPAHDPNDYEMGKRHGLEFINILNPDATINAAGGVYAGLDRFVARKRIVADLEAQGLLVKVEDHVHQVGHSYRSDAVIEPYLSEQWFVSMKPLAEEAIKAVEDGRTRFVPKSWENTYFHWLRNVRDWPISRQLWWGHQIPVWYCADCDGITVSDEGAPAKCEKCGGTKLRQEEDVLDTWFSSALWPFSTMGWPDATEDLARYYPTSALLTAHEIIFFWVARMIVMGLKFMGDVPFRDVYIHPMVFDEKTRKKMSKSLGNIIDPLNMIEKYGTDATRMTVAAYAVKGANLYLSIERFESYRNFMNKVWNSARFVLMNTEDLTAEDLRRGLDPAALPLEDQWILASLGQAIARVDGALTDYEFDQYVHHLYHFVWDEYCDWYLEMVKGRLYSKDPADAASRRNAQIVLITVLEAVTRLLHPVSPFITEEIWQRLRETYGAVRPGEAMGLGDALAKESIMIAPWPTAAGLPAADPAAMARMDGLMEAIGAVRKIRSEMNVSPAQTVDVAVRGDDAEAMRFIESQAHHLRALARVGEVSFGTEAGAAVGGALTSTAVAGSWSLSVALPASMIEAERERLGREIEKLEKLRVITSKKLGNASFVDRAPAEVVTAERERLAEAGKQLEVLRAKLAELAVAR
jgi:valyl-tRNA synthetase